MQPRVAAVLALEDPALNGHVESVHDFRIATRSLRAALRTLTRRPDATFVGKTRRTIQIATRALADTRDRDVGRALLARVKPRSPEEAALKRRLVGLSESDRRLALTRCLAHWPKEFGRQLLALLKHNEPPVKTVIRRARAEAWQQRRRALDVMESLRRKYDPLRLHELRRRIRSLRYAMELLSDVESGAAARVIRLKPLQSALGDIQDRIVLSRWLSLQARKFRQADPALSADLRRAAGRMRAESVEAHARFLSLRPREVLEKLALHVDSTRPRRGSGS